MFNVKESVYKNFPSIVEKLPPVITNLMIKSLQCILKEKQFQALNEATAHLKGSDFADGALAHLNITHTLNPSELKNIPSTGKLIIIANHITGAPDSFSLVQVVANARENKKVRMVVNGMVMGMEQASDIMIPVDTISGKITKQSIQAINTSLDNDEAIIIFPAGYVNRLSFKGLMDIPWKSSFFKIAKRQSCPIIPIRIKGRNSFLFYFLSIILPTKLSALFLPGEFINASKRKPLHFHIGKVIPSSSFSDISLNTKKYVDLFYQHLYRLGTHKPEILQTEITIAPAENKMMLNNEVKEAEFLGRTFDGKEIIIAEPSRSSFLLRELGRSREISFRAIGGGTGKARDNDPYDNYYRHLILWDAKELEIVGAYRIGECCKIIKERGVQGLYTNNLYNYDESFKEYCSQSIELGRSFVQPKYWGSRALDYLLQGIVTYIAHHPQVRYTYGTVTINADTPKDAVAALVYFYSHHFACPANLITAKNPYVMAQEHQVLFDSMFKDLSYKDGIVVLKKHLKDLGSSVPTLFKQYAEFYEEGAVYFANFSVNDGLLGVVEGFIITDNSLMKESKKKRYLKNFEKPNHLDPLTNLYNLTHFNEVISSITKYQRKSDINFALVIIHADHNKPTNEDIEINSSLLKNVAATLVKSLRDEDILAKYNDKEFIVMIKDVTDTKTKNILQKIEFSLDRIKIDADTTITCSIGAAIHNNTSEAINDTLLRAEEALVQAKKSVKDKIVIKDKNDFHTTGKKVHSEALSS